MTTLRQRSGQRCAVRSASCRRRERSGNAGSCRDRCAGGCDGRVYTPVHPPLLLQRVSWQHRSCCTESWQHYGQQHGQMPTRHPRRSCTPTL